MVRLEEKNLLGTVTNRVPIELKLIYSLNLHSILLDGCCVGQLDYGRPQLAMQTRMPH